MKNLLTAINILSVCIFFLLSKFFFDSWSEFEDFYRIGKTREQYIEFSENTALINRYNVYFFRLISRAIRDGFHLDYVDMWDVKFRIVMRFFHLSVSVVLTSAFWFTGYKCHLWDQMRKAQDPR
jgi:hypothetical protein